MSKTVRLPRTSRMGLTTLYQWRDEDGRLVNTYIFGTWISPEFPESDDDIYHTVEDTDVGRLDLISDRYYGTPSYWWVIAHVNEIEDPLTMDVGTKIRIPALRLVTSVLGALPSSLSAKPTDG